MNFILFSMFLSPFVGYGFYNIFFTKKKIKKYNENYTNINHSKAGIKFMDELIESPKPRKKVRFSNKIESF